METIVQPKQLHWLTVEAKSEHRVACPCLSHLREQPVGVTKEDYAGWQRNWKSYLRSHTSHGYHVKQSIKDIHVDTTDSTDTIDNVIMTSGLSSLTHCAWWRVGEKHLGYLHFCPMTTVLNLWLPQHPYGKTRSFMHTQTDTIQTTYSHPQQNYALHNYRIDRKILLLK